MEPEAAPPGDTFVTKGRVRLAEAVRHLVDATLTAEDEPPNVAPSGADRSAVVLGHVVKFQTSWPS